MAAPPRGIYVPVPTFFTSPSKDSETPALDLPTQVEHSLFLAKAGIRGLVLLGSTGEAVHLSGTERIDIIKAVRKGLEEKGYASYPLIAGTASNSIAEVVEQLKEAKRAGAQWGMVLAPGYFAGSIGQEGVRRWYEAVADQSAVPIMIYHYPGVSNNIMLSTATIKALAQHPNIVGAKFSHGDVSTHAQVALDSDVLSTTFHLYTGLGAQLLPVVQLGAAGAIDGLAAFFPHIVVKLYEIANNLMGAEELKAARKLQLAICKGENLVAKTGTAGIKEAVKRCAGIGNAVGRWPLTPLSDEDWALWESSVQDAFELEASLKKSGITNGTV